MAFHGLSDQICIVAVLKIARVSTLVMYRRRRVRSYYKSHKIIKSHKTSLLRLFSQTAQIKENYLLHLHLQSREIWDGKFGGNVNCFVILYEIGYVYAMWVVIYWVKLLTWSVMKASLNVENWSYATIKFYKVQQKTLKCFSSQSYK